MPGPHDPAQQHDEPRSEDHGAHPMPEGRPSHPVPGVDVSAGAGHDDHAMHDGHEGHEGHEGHGGHGEHAAHDPEAFRRLFWLSLILTIPTVAFSAMVQDWLGYSLNWVPGDELVSPILGTVIFVYGGRIFLQGGWDE